MFTVEWWITHRNPILLEPELYGHLSFHVSCTQTHSAPNTAPEVQTGQCNTLDAQASPDAETVFQPSFAVCFLLSDAGIRR